MTADERAAFLAANRKVQVATVGPDGAPHLSTLFYALVGGRLAFWTYAASQKAVNLRRDPRITCLVEDGEEYGELRGLMLRGTAETADDPGTVRRVGTAVTAAMTGTPEEALEAAGAREEIERAGRKRVAVFVREEHAASWDHSKL
ncbi:pyridoxamine 5'-phosphate oxidase family protein [Nocardiopsis sp. RSe5-2]|uniref:Pyridoxamine 5'-phosphate oxidase family protein n=1 Tax=Nocardiopsis endophytica TaxID=3018445 RepID=A0ABT4U526_9ACTN|nr:pyridoxamine 5'-phosphate oxidase family protein [Nocardiopsis endophytica]MDA2812053.1 pyridoxamine 5'-phosphate oxidase family protein [Nocardiopsis endophytica]